MSVYLWRLALPDQGEWWGTVVAEDKHAAKRAVVIHVQAYIKRQPGVEWPSDSHDVDVRVWQADESFTIAEGYL